MRVFEFQLYLESGPRLKTTMVHVLDLLGCVANGPTTEAALEATPGEIREYLRFLQRHGEPIDPDALFTTRIAAHVMEGTWIGYGDPAPGFAPDFEPLTGTDQKTYRGRFNWLGQELDALVGDMPAERPTAKPERGRSIHEIVSHIANAEPEYIRAAGLGKPENVKEILRTIEADPKDLPAKLADLWRLIDTRLGSITDAERSGRIQRGQTPWTVRRGFRRLLEHPWEHLREIQRRLEGATTVAKRSV